MQEYFVKSTAGFFKSFAGIRFCLVYNEKVLLCLFGKIGAGFLGMLKKDYLSTVVLGVRKNIVAY